MTIPLDNLYHYIDGLFSEPIVMYLFYPHGSKNILSIKPLKKFDVLDYCLDRIVFPSVICHDQEPLNYYFYDNLSDDVVKQLKDSDVNSKFEGLNFTNLRLAVSDLNIYDKVLLLHSEKNSLDLKLYEKENYIGVYYWCHALIAKDWYRFANYDTRLINNGLSDKDFLVYCRDFTGSREYRIKFQELLHLNDLAQHSVTGILKDQDHNNFDFKNQCFLPKSWDFLNYLKNNTTDSTSSACYVPEDFNNTNISVVLETVFDNEKIHLTEKILRPIACGHPFILAAGPGSLEYLRSYGFKTFSPWINEEYDLEHNSLKRLEKIIYSMKKFNELSFKDKIKAYEEIKKIADYNKQWFFSDNFFNLIVSELVTNINIATAEIKKTRSTTFRSRKKSRQSTDIVKQKKQIVSKYIRELKNFNRHVR